MPNDDLISRKALLKALDVSPDEWAKGRTIIALINAAHAVDAEPVRHGKWEIINRNEARCSECKIIRNIGTQTGWNYCPNCGAKMEIST